MVEEHRQAVIHIILFSLLNHHDEIQYPDHKNLGLIALWFIVQAEITTMLCHDSIKIDYDCNI